MKLVYAITASLLLQACATVSSVDRAAGYYQDSAPAQTESLLESAGGSADDNKINELLGYQIKLPEKNRIAILKLSSDNYWRFYSNDFTQLNDSLVSAVVTKLRASERVYDASFLPAMLVAEKKTVPALREAAARFQADLLLAYRSSCQSYQKYRLINPSETKSYCSVEAVLLDVRSGVIAKSVVSTQDFVAEKAAGDTNFAETIKKAELEAVAKALGNVANEVVMYLSRVPVVRN